MKIYRWLLTAAGGLLLVFFAFRAGGPEGTASAPTESTTPRAATDVPPAAPSKKFEADSPGSPVSTPAVPATGVTLAVPQILDAIQQAAISYDAKELPKIQPFLIHTDPEVRAAALEGVLILGDAAGSPLLRQAASTLKDPREAVKYLEAADYLELPSGSLLAGKKKASGTTSKAATPSKGEPSPRIPFRSKKD